ncbi:hypothetical protein PoB_004387700 [Plakobranchus ocellatus]|uniref:Uncharacterized protein n=1 Tax=Plakobranchus ocellatus TaxID=259542 RepID=A0AAV4BEJ8_9GAST|nr:hypothetical protein PoB_004387700 [Plakobranchus ocellatus]
MPSPRSPSVTTRSQARPYQHRIFLAACRTNLNKDLTNGQQLWKQMMIGFTCAGIVGLIMLVVGTVFISEAVRKEQPITVMLCVMGIGLWYHIVSTIHLYYLNDSCGSTKMRAVIPMRCGHDGGERCRDFVVKVSTVESDGDFKAYNRLYELAPSGDVQIEKGTILWDVCYI